MTTIKITVDAELGKRSEVEVSAHTDRASIFLCVDDGPLKEVAGVHLSPAKAREVIAAMPGPPGRLDMLTRSACTRRR